VGSPWEVIDTTFLFAMVVFREPAVAVHLAAEASNSVVNTSGTETRLTCSDCVSVKCTGK